MPFNDKKHQKSQESENPIEILIQQRILMHILSLPYSKDFAYKIVKNPSTSFLTRSCISLTITDATFCIR